MIISKDKEKQIQSDLFKLLIVLSMPYIASSFIHHGFLALLPFIREEFILSRAQVGYYSTCFFISAALLAIFTGSFVDKMGPRKSMLSGIGVMSFIFILYGFSPTYRVLLFLALLSGLGFSIITPSVNKGVIIATPPKKRAVSMGIMQSGIGVGSIAGASLLPLLGENIGWRNTAQIAAFFALLTGFLVYKFYQEQNSSHLPDHSKVQKEGQLSFKEKFWFLLRNKPLFRVCVLGMVFGISCGAVLSHLTVFLSEDLRMTRALAGLGLGVLQFGGILSRPTWGWISDRLLKGNRQISLFVIGISMGVTYLLFGLFLNSPQVSAFNVFIFSFLLGYTVLGWVGVHLVTVGELAGEKQVGIATGLSLLFTRTGMLISPPVFGFIADIRGSYQLGWLLFGSLILATSFLFLLRD